MFPTPITEERLDYVMYKYTPDQIKKFLTYIDRRFLEEGGSLNLACAFDLFLLGQVDAASIDELPEVK